MVLRVTGGRWRGRVVRWPVTEGVRPTSGRAREALFSIVGQDLTGLRVLDAFGGTGMLGLEAASRGADVVVVEQRGAVAAAIRRTFEAFGAAKVETGDVLVVGPRLGRFDGVLCDPPYAMDPGPVLEALGAQVDGWLVFETSVQTQPPLRAGGLELERTRCYGDSALHLYRRSDESA